MDVVHIMCTSFLFEIATTFDWGAEKRDTSVKNTFLCFPLAVLSPIPLITENLRDYSTSLLEEKKNVFSDVPMLNINK